MYSDLQAAKDSVYDPCHFTCSEPLMEAESVEYGACTFQLNNRSVLFRIAKITPTKVGLFVAIWKRIQSGSTQPYDVSDSVDFFIISVRKDNNFGQFIFPKSVLAKHDIISIEGQGGKRGIRVYPPWENNLNRQAQKTQEWQVQYFLNIPQNGVVDIDRAQMLYSSV